jgi:hypothetical protein
MEPFRSPDGTLTTLRDSLFSTVPGSPAYVARAHHHSVNLPGHGMVDAAVAAHATGVAGRFHHDVLFADDTPAWSGSAATRWPGR